MKSSKTKIILISLFYLPATIIGELIFELFNLIWLALDYDGLHENFFMYFNPLLKGIFAGIIAFKIISFFSNKLNIYDFERGVDGYITHFNYLCIFPLVWAIFSIFILNIEPPINYQDTVVVVITLITFRIYGKMFT